MSGETTHYVLDYAAGDRILAETTPTETVTYLYGDDCLGEFRDDEPLYYLPDGEGYTRQGADADGDVTSAWLFDPDGVVLEGPEGPVSHLVCGGVYDWSTGLLYKNGGYFDPNLGIWLALAPLVIVQEWRKKRRSKQSNILRIMLLGFAGMLLFTACCMTNGNSPLPTPTPQCVDPLPTPDKSLVQHAVVIKPFQPKQNDGLPGSLGTVIEGGSAILTHNHFSNLNTSAGVVFTDYQGKPLIVMNSDMKKNGIDSGSMKITLQKNNLQTDLNCTAAPLDRSYTGNQCDAIQVVYYDEINQSLDVFATYITNINKHSSEGDPLIYYAEHLMITRGDSGGGVFRNGYLFANTRSYEAIDHYNNNGDFLWEERTDKAYAALLPNSL